VPFCKDAAPQYIVYDYKAGKKRPAGRLSAGLYDKILFRSFGGIFKKS
jgi:hypothetical protein